MGSSSSRRHSSSLAITLGVIMMAVLYAEDTNAASIRQNIGLTTLSPVLNQTRTGNNTVKSTTPEVCEDHNRKCSFWYNFGYCYNGYVKGYMRKACKKTCGFCGHMSGKCRDKFFYCPSWTRFTGLFACKLSFYKTRCPYTCRACED